MTKILPRRRGARILTRVVTAAAFLMVLATQPATAQHQPVLLPKPIVVPPARALLLAQQLEWHKSLLNMPLPKEGCYKAEYPHLAWQEVACIKPPDIPMPPRSGALADSVGNGYDYSAQVTGQLISVIGSFDTATTTGESGFTYQSPTTAVADAYTLQLNSNFFNNPPACSGAATPASCQGWQQYVYSSKSAGAAYIQYWLINYGNACPAGWNTYGSDCYRNSTQAVSVPLIAATALAQTSLTGSVTAGGNDRLDLASGSNHYSVTSPDNIVTLANYWNTAEFAVVGDCCGYAANFNANTALAVRSTVHNGTTTAPVCVLEGFTGETNNLFLVPTPAIGTQQAPTLISDQNASAASPASCAVASGIGDTHLTTFTPTPQVNAPVSSLKYDFQAEGEFVLAKLDNGFEVQNRQISGAPNWPNAAVNQAVAARIGGSVVVFSAAGGNAPLLLNGTPLPLADGQKHVLPKDGDISRHGNSYVVRDMHGDSVQVILQNAGAEAYIDVYVGLGRWPASVQGLLVNARENVNAVVTRTGTVYPAPFNFSTFYSVYGDSWRVAPEQSLFTAAAPHLLGLRSSNPAIPFYSSDLSKAAYAAAKTNCQKTGVAAAALDDCILDVAVIGNKSAALSHVHPLLSRGTARANIFATEDIKPLIVPK